MRIQFILIMILLCLKILIFFLYSSALLHKKTNMTIESLFENRNEKGVLRPLFTSLLFSPLKTAKQIGAETSYLKQ